MKRLKATHQVMDGHSIKNCEKNPILALKFYQKSVFLKDLTRNERYLILHFKFITQNDSFF